ncbi:hypothetical protein [uncultured Mediterranean phage uvMED]|nr:hypothetical protein [uncultured Mediterranean phage uvMED]|tara:strand:- start:4 stop:468 length:465 start_codon:yes stop_codon:yes gene_type:complete
MKEEQIILTDSKQSKLGRPSSKPNQVIVEEICDWIAHGKTLRSYCRLKGKPSWRTIYNWLDKDSEFSSRFTQVRMMGADAIAEEALELIDTPPVLTGSEDSPKLDNAHVNWMRNRADLRLKLLAKWFPQRYGDRVGLDHTGDIKLVINTGIPQG